MARIYYINAKKEEATWKKSLYKELSLCLNTSLYMHKVHFTRPGQRTAAGKEQLLGSCKLKNS